MGSLSFADITSTPSTKRLSDKVVIITGGASGIGESTARLFARHGAMIIIADIQDDKGQSLCKEINNVNATTTSVYIHCDVTNHDDVKSTVNFAITNYGKLDIMYSNAGITGDLTKDIVGTDPDDFRLVFDVNVYGAFLCSKEAARVMIPARQGVILFSSSITAVVSGEAPHAYGMSKHALIGMMKNFCVELGEYGIRVNAVSPCSIATPLLTNAIGKSKSFLDDCIHESGVLKGVVPQAEDIAEAALFLVSDEAKYVSGMNLVVDGGYTIANKSFTAVMTEKMSRSHQLAVMADRSSSDF